MRLDEKWVFQNTFQSQDRRVETLQVSYLEDQTTILSQPDQVIRLFHGLGDRLFQKDMAAGLQAFFGHGIMILRRNHDRYNINGIE
jgi:hypothetical protein